MCHLDIPKGESCFYESGKFDMEFFSRYSHNECAEKWKDMNLGKDGEDWIAFECMTDAYPHDRFHEWQRRIGEVYGVLDGYGL